MKFLSLSLKRGLLLSLLLAPRAYAGLAAASARVTVGDISNLYLSPDGFELNVMNKDFLGGTDKYFMGGMSYGWLQSFGREGDAHVVSYELLTTWAALTPGTSETVGGRALPRSLGRFADWMSVLGTLSYGRMGACTQQSHG